jgi:precorrin-2 dehydrogenase/sirohydrochlorin ferrochelatase
MSEWHVPVYFVGSFLRCLVVGGGTVAQRKADVLLAAGAAVTVVSPELTPRLSTWAKRGSIEWKQGKYRSLHLKGANLVIGATNDAVANERVFLDACKAGIPVNIVDDPAHCTFIVPSFFKKGPIQVAVTTGGAAPAIAAKLRRKIEETISDEHVCMVTELRKMRPEIKRLCAPDKERFWRSMGSLCVSSYKGKPAKLKCRLRAELKARSKSNISASARKGRAAK